ncbi:HvfC/BufC N-terminal domain-containing protein [Frigoriglobus tundricola]|uniref:Putative DNA-binding domain-containing protein n=1 Tax=Frigoriglobus tundricola TaxID=2774151 RepID=A0A6M5Z4T9_9BACT|nr:DNA-binding domain-containing protein [Frigoriglobus tundricola]QJX00807.1 hypothetical protein FTUN_8445 [Frigoriglobus tundricola]
MRLDSLQNWFQAAITHPDGVWQALDPVGAASVLTCSKALPALDRLAVYGRAYFARLLDCLREEYAVLKVALGDEVFDAFAVEYLQRFPSQSYTLFDLGSRFPQFLRDTRPATNGEAGAAEWPDFLIDLAELELAFNEVFDGPGIEGKRTLDEPAIAAVSPHRLSDAHLIPAPCVRVLALKYPVHGYFAAVKRNEDASLPEPAATFLAITRQRFAVRHFELSKPAHVLLSALLRGEALGVAIEEVARGSNYEGLEQQLGEWFRNWAAQGFFLGIVDDPDAVADDL